MNDSKDIFIHKDAEFKIQPILGNHIAIDKGVYCTVNSKYWILYPHFTLCNYHWWF